MGSRVQTGANLPQPVSGEQVALLRRVVASATFAKSNRLRELLAYVGERSLTDPDRPIREHEIGVAVFGRPDDYDSSQDTLVRVQASQLRKKLQQYFDEEGRDEPLILELPKGSYSLTYRPRSAPPVVLPRLTVKQPRWMMILTALCAILGVVTVLLGVENHVLNQRLEFGMGPRPEVDRFWTQMFGNHPTHLVLADANLVIFEDRIEQQIALTDYQGKAFDRVARARIQDPAALASVLDLIARPSTSIADANMARRIGLIAASTGIPLDVMLARDLTISQMTTQNTILLGSRRANPWVSLAEARLNFQTVFSETPRAASFVNRNPKPGERSNYPGVWARLSYCRVAFLPNAKSTGTTLLISGTDVPSTEAGGELITNEGWLRTIRTRLGVKKGAPIPYFEILLQAELVSNAISNFQLIASRTY